MKQNAYTDLEHLHIIAERFRESGLVLSLTHKEWVTIGMGCASLGEAARDDFHTICQCFDGYTYEESNSKFDNCLKTTRGEVTLGSIILFAQQHGIDTKLPRGRRPMTPAEAEEKQANKIERIEEELTRNRRWRYNILTDKPEYKDDDKDWQPMDDRKFNTIISKLRKMGLGIQDKALRSLIGSSDFSFDFNPVTEYLNSLPVWNPETDPDYIHETFAGHMKLKNPEDEGYVDTMSKRFMVGMVKFG